MKVRVLFVCLGNICRSPMAEAIFRDLVEKEKLTSIIDVDSCGIDSWHVGELPHEGTRKILSEQHISYQNIHSRQIKNDDFVNFDYIIAMDDQNIKDLQEMNHPSNKCVVRKLMDFVENPSERNVPDPYYYGNFSYTYELVSTGCNHLLKHIKTTHHI